MADAAAGGGSHAAETLSFAGCCRMLEQLERTPKSDAKLGILFSDTLQQQLQGADLYPLLRLVLPQLDRERTYNLKEKKIAKLYIATLGMASESRDAQKLEHFTDPKVVASNAVGDFAAVLYDVLKYRSLASSAKPNTLTIGDVNALLDELVKAESFKKPTAAAQQNEANGGGGGDSSAKTTSRKDVFMRLATGFSAMEQKWIVRMILKDLKVGLRQERVLKYIHPDAMEMYNHTNDLHKVCGELRDSSIRYVPTIEPFQVFSPMLAKRVDFGECTTAINADAFVMEPKLDGERITCHVKRSDPTGETNGVQFISRNGINYTELYGPSVTPIVLKQVKSGVDCILDGEMMVWDNVDYRLREFGLLKSVANALKSGESPHRWLCYVVWDVVYLAGDNSQALLREVYDGPAPEAEVSAVMGLPLRVRRKLLLRLVTPLDHRIVIIEQTLVNSRSAKERHEMVMAEVDRQVENGGEGVILKDLNSHYMCGESSRQTKKWIKLKPDYAGMTSDLDVIILGGFYGTGRRRSGDVSVFLLGALSRSLDETSAQAAMKPRAPCPAFYTFAKVGTGYNLEELDAMRKELEPHWQLWDDNNIPAHFNGWKPQKSDLRPDVWIDPRHSKIIEVYGFELTFTTLYQTGLTLRFPRCKSIRSDKNWHECLTVQDLNSVRSSLFNKRAADVSLGQKRTAKRVVKRDTKALPRGAGGIVAQYSQAKLEGIQVQRDVFEGQEFCVLPGKYPSAPASFVFPQSIEHDGNARELSKQVIEKLLHANGASIVQNPIADSTSFVLAASDTGFKVANLKKQGVFNIVSLHWVLSSITAGRLIPLTARDLIFANEDTRNALAKEYDQYGDHYTEPVTRDQLALSFREVAKARSASGDSSNRPLESWQSRMRMLLEEEAEAMDCRFTFLSHCVVYVDQYTSIDTTKPSGSNLNERDPFGRMKLWSQQLRLYGAVVVDHIDASVTHIVVLGNNASDRLEKLKPIVRALRRTQSKEPPVVTHEWVEACVAQKTQLPVSDFVVHV